MGLVMRKILILLTLLTVSCIKEQFEPAINSNKDYIEINFGHKSFENISISTKSTLPSAAENRILNVYAFVFNDQGKIAYKHFFDASSRVSNVAEMEGANHFWYVEENDPHHEVAAQRGYTNGTIRIKSVNVSNGTIYLIANIDEALFNISRYSLAFVDTINDLENIVCSFQTPSTTRMGNFLMVGKTSITVNNNTMDLATDGAYDYQDSQDGSGTKRIMLERVDSKIEVRVGIVPGSITERIETIAGTPIPVIQTIESFTPDYWQVVNLPKGTYITSHNEDAEEVLTGGYFDSPEYAFEDSEMENVGTPTERQVHKFSFYTLENRQSSNKKASVSDNYHLRDKRLKNPDGSYAAGNMWEYAPENATYLKIVGNVSMAYQEDIPEGASQTLHTLATYYIHLGNFATDKDNYDIERNKHYVYTINLRGVDKIQVEVELDQDSYQLTNETQSGATGDVFISQEDIYIFDAHYGQRVFRFNIDGILHQCGGDLNNLTWYVSTPYGRKGMPLKVGGSGVDPIDAPNGLDYKWVHFMINNKNASYTEPHGSVDGSPLVVTNERGAGVYSKKNRIWPGLYLADGTTKNPAIMDVIDLCAYLRKQAAYYRDGLPNDFDTNGDIYATAFVDEYYYDIDPISEERRTSQWHEFVNKPIRTMHIMCNSAVSADGESSLIKSAVSIRQRSIQTIYDTEFSTEGWGCENIDEFKSDRNFFFSRAETRTNGGGGSYYTECIEEPFNGKLINNGLYNSGHLWGLLSGGANNDTGTAVATFNNTVPWSRHLDYLKTNDHNVAFMRETDTDATLRYSCLMRNRDENGNGFIDKEEIKWYLASIGQLKHLFIGSLGLTGDAQIYNNYQYGKDDVSGISDNFFYYWRSHIVSSTMSGVNNQESASRLRPIILWTEEGISSSIYGLDQRWKKPGVNSTRCVRNLDYDSRNPNDMVDPQDIPESIITMISNADGTYSFDIRKLNKNSKRIKITNELLPLDEHSSMSLTYESFQTALEYGNNGALVNYQVWEDASTPTYKNIQEELRLGISRCPDGYRIPNIREMAICQLYIPSGSSFWGGNRSFIVSNYYSFGQTVSGGNGYDAAGGQKGGYSWGISSSNITVTPETWATYIRCVRDIDL